MRILLAMLSSKHQNRCFYSICKEKWSKIRHEDSRGRRSCSWTYSMYSFLRTFPLRVRRASHMSNEKHFLQNNFSTVTFIRIYIYLISKLKASPFRPLRETNNSIYVSLEKARRFHSKYEKLMTSICECLLVGSLKL